MKTSILATLVTLALTFNLKSQITLENVYSHGDLKLCNLSSGGYKYYLLDKANNQIVMYDMNHSIYRTINVIPPAGSYTYTYVKFLSDKLFDTDNLIEFVIGYRNTSPPFDIPSKIYNENGSLLLQSYYQDEFSVLNVGGIFKLKKYSTVSGSSDSTKIYSLPGELPCDACGGTAGIVKSNYNSGLMDNPFPNPTNGQLTIPYHFSNGETRGKIVVYDVTGKEIYEFKVDNTFTNLIIDTQNFSSGTYYYKLKTSNGISDAKKIIVVK